MENGKILDSESSINVMENREIQRNLKKSKEENFTSIKRYINLIKLFIESQGTMKNPCNFL